MSTASPQRMPAVLYDVDWPTYSRLLRAFDGQRRFRHTYDRGTLEIMSPLWEHEGLAYLIGRLIDAYCEENDIPCRAGRSVTLRRRRKKRGLEPDNCYWIANAPKLKGKRKLNLKIDPPPDLAVEVDITHQSLNRLGVYASLEIPEVWRYSSSRLTFLILQNRVYVESYTSLSFPEITTTQLEPFLDQFGQFDETTIVRGFRSWLKTV